MPTLAQAITQYVGGPEELEQRRENAEKQRRNAERRALLQQVREVGPVGTDVANHITRYKFGYDTSHDLDAILRTRTWTTLYAAAYELVQQQRRCANLLGVRMQYEEAVR